MSNRKGVIPDQYAGWMKWLLMLLIFLSQFVVDGESLRIAHQPLVHFGGVNMKRCVAFIRGLDSFVNSQMRFSRYVTALSGSTSTANDVDGTNLQKQYFFSQKSFIDLGLNPKLRHILNCNNIENPSRIQALTFQPIIQGRHVIIGDQTGSGKTLGYLLPILQRLFFTKNESYPVLSQVNERRPVVVILTPTTELAS